MSETRPDREQLIRRRDEIIRQLERVNADQRIELDRDPEEQAIEIEHEEVARSIERKLRREMTAIEDQLAGYED